MTVSSFKFHILLSIFNFALRCLTHSLLQKATILLEVLEAGCDAEELTDSNCTVELQYGRYQFAAGTEHELLQGASMQFEIPDSHVSESMESEDWSYGGSHGTF